MKANAELEDKCKKWGGLVESNDIFSQESWKLGPSLKLLLLLVLFSESFTKLKNVLFCMTVTVSIWK